MNKAAMVTGREVMYGLSNMDFQSPRPSRLWPLLNAQLTNSRDQHWVAEKLPFPRVVASYLMAGSVHWVAYWNRHLFWIWICLPCILLRKLASMNLQNTIPTITVFYTALLLIKELTLWHMQCSNGPKLMECTGLAMFPPTRRSWLDRIVE